MTILHHQLWLVLVIGIKRILWHCFKYEINLEKASTTLNWNFTMNIVTRLPTSRSPRIGRCDLMRCQQVSAINNDNKFESQYCDTNIMTRAITIGDR